ncbi:hypothetical protein ACJJTC_007076 [Scirpophaga incertulas]
MPIDYRRFNGPEDSVSYKQYTKNFLKSYEELCNELIDENEHRKDGRALDEARTMYARTNMISQAKGSSYVELKKTKVVCSVFDPREIPNKNEFSPLGQIYCEVKFAPFSCPRKRRALVPDAEEKDLSLSLKKALEPAVCRYAFPNYQIDVFVYILEHDGACLAGAINAAGLALANAAVPMYDTITACSIAVIEDKLYVDPTEEEEYVANMTPAKEGINHGIITVAMLSTLEQVAGFTQLGSMDGTCVINATEILQKECQNIVPIIHQILVKDVIHNIDLSEKLEKEAKLREAALNENMEEWKKLLSAD